MISNGMEPEKKSNGASIGLIVIIIVLIVGGIYMWQVNKNSTDVNTEPITAEDTSELDALEQEAGSIDTSTGVDANAVY